MMVKHDMEQQRPKIVRDLYLLDLPMIFPATTVPMALPTTTGTMRVPDSPTDALSAIWK